jgi:acetyl esterase/lipase
MPSLRARAVIFLLKRRHFFRLQFRRRTIDGTTSIEGLRAKSERSAARLGGSPQDVRIEPVDVGTIAAEWIKPIDSDDHRTILYFHGGGYVMGSLTSHRGVVAKFVRESGVRALHFQYRLAPEHPFPAALEDSVATYSWLLAQGIRPEQIVFLGDSAGGGLCLATLLALRDRDISLPAGASAMSPWTDLTCASDSYSREDDLAPNGSWQVFSRYYAGSCPVDHPWISPLHGELTGLPPLLLCTGDAESMADDTIRFAAKAEAAGVNVHLLLGEGMVHCYPVFSPLFPEAKRAFQEICRFLRGKIPVTSSNA